MKLKKKEYDEYKDQLFRRVGHIQGGLEGMSLKSTVLDTASLIELYYNSYNPEISKREKIKDVEKIKIDE